MRYSWSLLGALIVLSCAPPPPPGTPPPPPPLKPLQVLDNRSFAFDVKFLAGDMVGCALMEGGVYRLSVHDRRSGKRLKHVALGPGQDWLHAMAVNKTAELLAVGFRTLRKEQGRDRKSVV